MPFAIARENRFDAVRKITESVDIPRLRVRLAPTAPIHRIAVPPAWRSRLSRRQSEAAWHCDDVRLQVPPISASGLRSFARKLRLGLLRALRRCGGGERQNSYFAALSATHEDGGAISDYGEEYSAAEINAAERDKRDDPQLIDIGVTTLAYSRRKHVVESAPFEPPSDPLQIQKKKVRTVLEQANPPIGLSASFSQTNTNSISSAYGQIFTNILSKEPR